MYLRENRAPEDLFGSLRVDHHVTHLFLLQQDETSRLTESAQGEQSRPRPSRFQSHIPPVEAKLAVSGVIISSMLFLWALLQLVPVVFPRMVLVNNDDELTALRELFFIAKNVVGSVSNTYTPLVVLCCSQAIRQRFFAVLRSCYCCCCCGVSSDYTVPGVDVHEML